MLVQSPLLSALPHLAHGFSTRLGGVSEDAFATLNLSGTGDAPARIAENRRRFARRLGFDGPDDLVQVDQIHGTRVLDASEARGSEADGIVSDRPRTLIGVRTADCVPILLVATDEAGRPEAVAAVHAGWRGATAGIVAVAVARIEAHGARVDRLYAAVGPCISLEHFEVGEEVVEAARGALVGAEPKTVIGPRGRPHLDLPDLTRRLLLQSGLRPQNVDVNGSCTFDNAAMFFSHRRDAGRTGRHLAAIAFGMDS